MKKYYDMDSKELKRKKRLLSLVVLILLYLYVPMPETENIFVHLVSQIVPLLTYEREYGMANQEYAGDYPVPDWFYEDEGKTGGEEHLAEEAASPVQQVVETWKNQSVGTVFTREELEKPDFLLNQIFAVDGSTYMTEDELSIENLMETDLRVENLAEDNSIDGGGREYKILIYHTHGSESFADSREGVKEDTIIGVGAYLAQVLEQQYGIAVYHDETSYDVIDGGVDRSRAYENAYEHVREILQQYPSIQVVIDLHRDGVDENIRLVTEVDGKPTAKIMFLNGVSRSTMNGDIAYLENPNKLVNLAFSFQMYLAGKERYGDYVRKVYVRSLRYNLHLLPRTTLIEVGAQNNTLEEARNAMEPLAAILFQVLS